MTISINAEVDLLSLWDLRRSNSADMLPLLYRYVPILRMGLEAKTSHSREGSGFLGLCWLCIMSFGVF